MASALTRSPLTPTRAKSAGPHTLNRDPMEDANSSGKRKRPRLDSGSSVYRSMSADPTGAASSNVELTKASPASPDGQPPSHLSEATDALPPIALTPSKVTINVREPIGTSSLTQQGTQINGPPSMRAGGGGHGHPANPLSYSIAPGSSSPNVISVSSSPAHSPEIEVAEVEDMNDDSGQTRWKPLESAAAATSIQDAKDVQTAMLDQFPHSAGQNLKKTVGLIALALGKNDLGDGDLLDALAAWIESYLQTTEPLESQWWDMIQDERDFWDELPSLVEALIHRSNTRLGTIKMTYSENGDTLDGHSPLQTFLVAYSSLALRMARIDHQTLLERFDDATIVSDLISDRYLQALSNVMTCGFLFWKHLIDVSSYDPKTTITAIVERFVQMPEAGVSVMSFMSKEILERSQRVPALVPKFFVQMTVVNRLMQHHHTLQQSMAEVCQEVSHGLHELPSQAYELFLLVDARFQHLISKQVPALTIDTCQGFVTELSTLLRLSVALDEQLLRKVMGEKMLPIQGLAMEDGAHLVELAWKFDTLRKCILHGRMEIRVQGVEFMQVELIHVYTKFIDNNPTQKTPHPIPQYLADFMLANKVVDYFVGVDSHPQLIQRCGNIIGFLLVTHRYTEAESDTIWRAVTNSQDSRFVEAILTILPTIFHVAQYPHLLYLTRKLNELSIFAFDGSMINYARSLLDSLRRTFHNDLSSSRMDIPPFHLCIKLIRQAAVEASLEASRRRQINHFAAAELGCFLHYGLSDSDRRTIYQECIQDISDQNDSATGSIAAINALVSRDPEKELSSLTQVWDLAHLVAAEYAHKIKTARSADLSSLMLQEFLDCRMLLIQYLILFVPEKITPDVGSRLWEYGVGSEALNHQTREAVWMCFLAVIRKILHRNTFIDQCVREHLPRLQPSFYTLGALQFAYDVSNYHFRTTISRPQEDIKQETTAEDLLWHMSLTALPGTIERRANGMLVALYLDTPENTRRTRTAIEAIHIGVVERCIKQLTSAASKLKSFTDGTSSGEDEPMVIVAPEDEIQKQRLYLSRSLTILKEFFWGVRTRPKYSPQMQTQSQLPHETRTAKGDVIQIRYQPFGVGTTGEMRTVEVGDLETMQEFTLRLKFLTGFSKLTLISGGQKLDLGSIFTRTLQDLRLDQKGLLLVKKDPDSEAAPDLASISGLRPVEAEILTHFLDLYPLLGLEERLGKEMFEFLLLFPPHSSIITLVCSEDTPLEIMFPPSAPFKILYSIHTMRQCVLFRTQNVPSNNDFTVHGIRSLTKALTTLSFSIGPQGTDVDITVAAQLLECLLQFLKEPRSFVGPQSLFTNPAVLLQRLQSMIRDSLAVDENADADALASCSFAAILKISLHVQKFWDDFKYANVCSSLLRRIVLRDPSWQLRRRVVDHIKAVCADLHLIPTATAQELIPYLWDNIATIIPHCLEAEKTSQEFFELAIFVFQRIDQSHCDTLDLAYYVQSWSNVLLRHEHDEFAGRETVDWLVHGLSNLLNWVFQYAKSAGNILPTPDDLLVKLFHTHLFPEISGFDDQSAIKVRVPNLHSITRQELYSIILVLSDDIHNYQTLSTLVRDLLCQGEGSYAWTWGFTQIAEEYHYDQNWNFDRSKTIRSPTGYPGMRNLSNTCYMNSLFTQLFMNVKFRGFMLGTNVADGAASQKLLQETQALFGYMQDTMLRAVDSQGIVDSLVTYDNTFIDVSVQMDVDEFYNLLFDRWEGQILLGADKTAFKGFYGGQIVQQIKSKECPHISERLEPFSAIQCDIHGKATLMDSLNAYVSGETMEGDNKYSCTTCGCYVDAVKRACFKEIPENLIFHLKRFDYDVMTGMRSKINDAFEFPHEIDMAPYHIDYQKNTSSPCVPDMFELVGVLVHAGNAESGHYYSYVRERPQNSPGPQSWVEFNDMDVTKFDPTGIADQCYGGFTEATAYSHRFQKNWNAYMLFYERMESRSSNEVPLPMTSGVPAKCPVPPEIERRVALSNAQFVRNYCMYDPAHALFARRFLEQLREVNNGTCSENHSIEKEAIWLSLEYLERVLSRSKDCSDFTKMLTSLQKVIGSCALCCNLALDWVKVHEHALRNLLLRCPNPKVRKEFASMIVIALQHLKKHEPYAYGFQDYGDGDPESSEKELRALGVFSHIATRLMELWTTLPSHARGWDDYFSLLTDMASLGVHEKHLLLNRSFLKHGLEILVVEHGRSSRLRSEHPHYAQYCRLMDKGRRFSLVKLTELLSILLEKINLAVDPVSRMQERRFNLRSMPLTRQEDELMQLGSELPRSKVICIFLEKILSSGYCSEATLSIVRMMTLAEPQFGMHDAVQKTIINGINIEPAHLAEPYLQAAIPFCEATPSVDSAQAMIRYIAGEVDTIAEHGGQEHLTFFAQARRIVNLRDNFEPGIFNRIVLRSVPQWAPALLHFREEHVRVSTVDLLKHLVFNHDIQTMDDEEHAQLIETAARDLQVACVRRCNGLVQLQKSLDSKTVEPITSVIKYCISNYYNPEEDLRAIAEADAVVTALEVLTASDVSEVASDYNNGSDDMPTDSDEEEFMTTSP